MNNHLSKKISFSIKEWIVHIGKSKDNNNIYIDKNVDVENTRKITEPRLS